MAGAPVGNQNAAKTKIWRSAIERALERRSQSRVDGRKEIDALAEKLLDLVAAGDLPALKEFGDRIDGKPAQAITGEDGGPIEVAVMSDAQVDARLAALMSSVPVRAEKDGADE